MGLRETESACYVTSTWHLPLARVLLAAHLGCRGRPAGYIIAVPDYSAGLCFCHSMTSSSPTVLPKRHSTAGVPLQPTSSCGIACVLHLVFQQLSWRTSSAPLPHLGLQWSQAAPQHELPIRRLAEALRHLAYTQPFTMLFPWQCTAL